VLVSGVTLVEPPDDPLEDDADGDEDDQSSEPLESSDSRVVAEVWLFAFVPDA
jgi:hypothetical protein